MASPSDLQARCEAGQELLMGMRYLEAEATLAAAEVDAWAARDFDTLARLYMPLQEARRQRRQRCGEGVVRLDVLAMGPEHALEPERIVTLDVGYLLQPDFGELEAVAFLNRVDNLIVFSAFQPTPPDQPFRPEIGAYVGATSTQVNDPRSFLAFGTELAVRLYPIEGVDVGASYAFQYIVDEDTGARPGRLLRGSRSGPGGRSLPAQRLAPDDLALKPRA